ncbi:hypothetical protein [Streptomyces sp. MMG1533]|uniref:hypothetical protein n=1 Tax=Streptomyces sp. MMG1533 TaxID=1415546 RepID=UPI001F172A81|nr:hypothetical protein [Streptomyces sp. MMG1533]
MPGAVTIVVEVRLTYLTGRALLPRLLEICTRSGFRILQVRAERLPGRAETVINPARVSRASVAGKSE